MIQKFDGRTRYQLSTLVVNHWPRHHEWHVGLRLFGWTFSAMKPRPVEVKHDD